MEMETKVISRVSIKPSSSTPKSLQKHSLSYLDQLLPPVYVSFIYFYPSTPTISNHEKSDHLKKSLPDLLSTFYPLAGRLLGNRYVDCNDGGVPFADAEADCDVSDAISNPNPEYMGRLLPYKKSKLQDFCMAVQATRFRCGGLAVGILLSHKIADGVSFFSFVNAWAASVRNGGGAPPPKFDAAAHFPPLDVLATHLPPSTVVEEDVGTSRLFRFPAAAISDLQEAYTAGGIRPGRVEALSAFIWTRFVSAAGLTSEPEKICAVWSIVNLRTRADPPLPGEQFGNLVWAAVTRAAGGDGGVEFVRKMREAVTAVDGGYVERLKKSEEHLREMAAGGEAVGFYISSMCRFPVYEADFGWGRPVWVGPGPLLQKDVAVLVDAESGGGIEAWVCLPKQQMEIFENIVSIN